MNLRYYGATLSLFWENLNFVYNSRITFGYFRPFCIPKSQWYTDLYFVVFRKITSKWFFFILWFCSRKPKYKDDGQKFIYKIKILLRGFCPRCLQPRGDLKISEGMPPKSGTEAEAECRSGGPRARRGARGDFQIPYGRGDLGQNPQNKIRILYIFFKSYTLSTSTSDHNLKTPGKNCDKKPAYKKNEISNPWLLSIPPKSPKGILKSPT